jgi:hypothetical protein
MKINSGATGEMLNTGEPQAEQNLRCVSPPWSSPVVENEARVSPWHVKAACGTPKNTENGPPV